MKAASRTIALGFPCLPDPYLDRNPCIYKRLERMENAEHAYVRDLVTDQGRQAQPATADEVGRQLVDRFRPGDRGPGLEGRWVWPGVGEFVGPGSRGPSKTLAMFLALHQASTAPSAAAPVVLCSAEIEPSKLNLGNLKSTPIEPLRTPRPPRRLVDVGHLRAKWEVAVRNREVAALVLHEQNAEALAAEGIAHVGLGELRRALRAWHGPRSGDVDPLLVSVRTNDVGRLAAVLQCDLPVASWVKRSIAAFVLLLTFLLLWLLVWPLFHSKVYLPCAYDLECHLPEALAEVIRKDPCKIFFPTVFKIPPDDWRRRLVHAGNEWLSGHSGACRLVDNISVDELTYLPGPNADYDVVFVSAFSAITRRFDRRGYQPYGRKVNPDDAGGPAYQAVLVANWETVPETVPYGGSLDRICDDAAIEELVRKAPDVLLVRDGLSTSAHVLPMAALHTLGLKDSWLAPRLKVLGDRTAQWTRLRELEPAVAAMSWEDFAALQRSDRRPPQVLCTLDALIPYDSVYVKDGKSDAIDALVATKWVIPGSRQTMGADQGTADIAPSLEFPLLRKVLLNPVLGPAEGESNAVSPPPWAKVRPLNEDSDREDPTPIVAIRMRSLFHSAAELAVGMLPTRCVVVGDAGIVERVPRDQKLTAKLRDSVTIPGDPDWGMNDDPGWWTYKLDLRGDLEKCRVPGWICVLDRTGCSIDSP